MEALVFGLIALNIIKRQQGQIVPEPAEFESFDLQSLEHFYDAGDNSPNRTPDRKRSYVPLTVS